MVNIRTLLKGWEAAPSFSEYIDIDRFIDSNIFRTKSGNLGCLLRIQGLDYESVTQTHLDSITARLERNFQIFGPGFSVYQYFGRTSHPTIPHREYTEGLSAKVIGYRLNGINSRLDALYETQIHVAVIVDVSQYNQSAFGWFTKVRNYIGSFFPQRTIAVSLAAQDAARGDLAQRVQTFLAATDDFAGATLLDADSAFRFIHSLLNVSPILRNAPTPEGATEWPAYFAADSNLRVQPTHLELDDHFVKVLTLKGLPRNTRPNLLNKLRLVQGNYHIVTVWSPEDQTKTISHGDNIIGANESTKQRASVPKGQQQLGPTRVRQSKEAISDELEKVEAGIATKDIHYGQYSLTIVAYDREPDNLHRVVAAFITAAQSIGITLLPESDFANLAFLATIPGAQRYNLRQKRVSEANHADLSFFYTLDTGDQINPYLKDEYLALFTTRNNEPYYFNLHRGEVGHTVIFGPTAMGKSFLANYLLAQSTKYNPYQTIIDLGGSYKYLTQLQGGNYNNFSNEERSFKINPFRLPQTAENLDFLTKLVCTLITDGGGTLDDAQKNEIYQKIKQLYVLDDPALRRLSTLARTLPPALSERLARWVHGGQYGYVFDNPDGIDSLTTCQIQTFNFQGFNEKSEFLEPLLFYILHRNSEIIYDDSLLGKLKIFLLDEAFLFFKNPIIREYLRSALLTWRKRNGIVIFATQAAGHVEASGLLEDVVSNCATKIFLANPSLNEARYQDIFKMSADATETIRTLMPRRELYLLQDPDPYKKNCTEKTGKVLRLEVSAEEVWLYANSAYESIRRDEVYTRLNHDLDATLHYLATHPDQEAA